MRWSTLPYLAIASLVVAGILQFSSGPRVETDLLAMLPATERNPTATKAIALLERVFTERAVFLVAEPSPENAAQAADLFAARLDGSAAFSRVLFRIPMAGFTDLKEFYAPYRFRIIPPSRSLPTEETALLRRVDDRLFSPMGWGAGTGLEEDPLGHFAEFLRGLPLFDSRMEPVDGALTARGDKETFVLVTAELKGSAFDPRVQDPVVDAVRSAEGAMRAAFPDARLVRTGAVFFAEESRREARREINLIGWWSTLGIVLLSLWAFRSVRHLLLGVFSVAVGLLAGTVGTIAVYGKLHLLTMVCGSTLIGVSVDYPMHLFAHHRTAGAGWDAREATRRLFPGLLLGWSTTLVGYMALFLLPFPGFRQIAVFSVFSLIASFLTTVLILPAWLRRPSPGGEGLRARLERAMAARSIRALGARAPIAWLALALVAAPFLAALHPEDDVRTLITASADLMAQNREIQGITGLVSGGQFFLVEGRDEGEVLEREEALRGRLEPLVASGSLAGVQGVADFVPSPARQEAAWRQFAALAMGPLASALREAGFRASAVGKVNGAIASQEGRTLTVREWMGAPFSAPFRHLWMGPTPDGSAGLVIPSGFTSVPALESAAAGLPGVSLVDRARSVSRIFGRYRRVMGWALCGMALLTLLIFLPRYGFRESILLLVPTVVSGLLSLAAVALAGGGVTLFHLFALLLLLGIGVDYAVFIREGRGDEASATLSVLLASSTTILSFAFLMASATPLLSGFALVLTVGVAASTLLTLLARQSMLGRGAGQGEGRE